MRHHLAALLLLATATMPAAAQQAGNGVERRVGKLEAEMRAVQRKVFPGGNQALLEAEIQPRAEVDPLGSPATSAVADLTERVDALERQIATLTGQVEQNGFRLQRLEDELAALRAGTEARFEELSRSAAPAPPPPADVPTSDPAPPVDAAPSTGDEGEDAYVIGYRLWEAGKFAEAQKALEAMAKKWPKHRRASYAMNLAGRAYLDDGKPATAAKLLLANYQTNPKGERAADSLYFLGQALMTLKKPAEACKVYDELEETYRGAVRDWVAQRLPKARADAKCGG